MYRRVVTFLGGAGLAGTLAFFIGVYLAFQPGWERWAEFFVPWSIALMCVPFALLVVYLYMRTRMGQRYVEQGRIEEAIAFTRERIEPHPLLRSRKEALFHRIALGRAYLCRQEYAKVEEVLGSGYAVPKEGRFGLEVCLWRMEAALRAEDLALVHRLWEEVEEVERPRSLRARVMACRAELAVREANHGEYETALEGALWAAPDEPRAHLVEVQAACRFEKFDAEPSELLKVLDGVFEVSAEQVPGRQGELFALRARLLLADGRGEEAEQALEEAYKAPCDSRSEYDIERVEKALARADGAPDSHLHSSHEVRA